MKRTMAILIALMMTLGCVYAYANDDVSQSDSNTTQEYATEEQDAVDIIEEDPEVEDRANSWRFKDGVPTGSNDDLRMKQRSVPSHPNATRLGIDVSEWQGKIDWEKVKASGVDFAILRCGYGMNQTNQDDAYFLRNAQECERLGIPYGVYLYSYATNTSRASSEADHVLRLLKGRDLSYPVYFDMEDNSTIGCDLRGIATTFCNKISAAGYPVGVYANLNWWNNYLTDSCFNNWHRWVAQYYYTCQYKGTYAMWQYSSSGRVSGISGNVDMNYLIGYPDDHDSRAVAMEEGTYTISSKAESNSVLSIKNAGTGDNVAAEMSNTASVGSNQRFELVNIGGKKYKIMAEHSGKALDVKNSNAQPGAELQQYQWHEANAQIWQFEDAGNGYYYLKSNLGTYLRYDTGKPNDVTTGAFDASDAQKWKLKVSDYRPVKNGVYNILSSADAGNGIEIKGASTGDRISVCYNKFNNYISQQFSVAYVGNGYYRITAEHSGKVFDVVNGSKEPGAGVQQYLSNGTNAQLWKFVDAGNGSYYIKSKAGMTIDSGDASVKGSAVSMEVMNFTPEQKWTVKICQSSGIKDGIYSVRSGGGSSYAVTQQEGNVQVNKFDNILEQKYRIEKVNGDYYMITDVGTGQVLDVANGSKAAGANLQIHDWNGTDAQLWRFAKTPDDKYVIKSKLGYFINAVSVSDNSNINLNSFGNSSGQKWMLSGEKLIYGEKPSETAAENINRVFGANAFARYAGIDRYKTAMMAADALKKSKNISKFDNFVIACGTDYPDALSGGYLATRKNAPLLLIDEACADEVIKYVRNNISSRGKIYILGGNGVVSDKIENSLKKIADVKRLYGATRYDTNMAILKEIDSNVSDVMICYGQNFADALSASAVNKPILLVNDELTSIQKKYLSDINPSSIFVIGGSGVISTDIKNTCEKYGKTVRIAGMNRYTTSLAVARAFYSDWIDTAVLACGSNFPDGLTGGVLAASMQSPVLLVDNGNYTDAEAYSNDISLKKVAAMGGQSLISDTVLKKMLN